MKRLGLFALALLVSSGCTHETSRFALRPPLLRDDDRSLPRAPPSNDESDDANALDVIALRPISHAFLFEPSGEAVDVNALDEVPDSSWFRNRVVSAADLARGPCPDEPVPPVLVRSAKSGGTTPGMVVVDARGQKYLIKLDDNGPRQPEITTAAEVIVSRLYWAIGFNAPCDDVIELRRSDFRVNAASYKKLPWGPKVPFGARELAAFLALATPGRNATLRMTANRWINGEVTGSWRTEGRRADDPNDRIAHEDRRELRGERLLAAWIAHWDSRGPNTLDAFVKESDGRGHIVHYFNDFNDSLGANPIRTTFTEPRVGFATVSNLPEILEDIAGFGVNRRPWDEVSTDPRYPNLGYFDIEHFTPLEFSPQTPLVRWARADASDLGWMARKIARLSPEHVRVVVGTGKLTNPAEEGELLRVLLGRREKILRAAFARSSPLTDVTVAGNRVCAIDLALEARAADPRNVRYRTELRVGAKLALIPTSLPAVTGASLCATIAHFAPKDAADDAGERYATLDLIRYDGETQTVLRAHFYDLGSERGFALVGLERL